MDNDYSVDVGEVRSTLRGTEVVVMRFITTGHRLLLDFRATELDGPLVRVVRPVTSVEERYNDLRRMRPRLPIPEKIVAVFWPRFAGSLESTGIWSEVMHRISDSGHVEAVRRADAAFRELCTLEERAQHDAIRGDGFRTLWSASARKR